MYDNAHDLLNCRILQIIIYKDGLTAANWVQIVAEDYVIPQELLIQPWIKTLAEWVQEASTATLPASTQYQYEDYTIYAHLQNIVLQDPLNVLSNAPVVQRTEQQPSNL